MKRNGFLFILRHSGSVLLGEFFLDFLDFLITQKANKLGIGDEGCDIA